MHAQNASRPRRAPRRGRNVSRYSKARCFYEAANAVARLVVGRRVTRIDLRQDARPREATSRIIRLRGQYDVWDEILLILAGPFAEARIGKRAVAAMLQRSPQRGKEAESWLQWLVDHGFAEDARSASMRAEAEVRLFLRTHWSTIEMVAAALMARGVLEAGELKQIFRESATTSDRW